MQALKDKPPNSLAATTHGLTRIQTRIHSVSSGTPEIAVESGSIAATVFAFEHIRLLSPTAQARALQASRPPYRRRLLEGLVTTDGTPSRERIAMCSELSGFRRPRQTFMWSRLG